MFSESFLTARPPAKLEIGQVLGGAFGAIGRNWLSFLILTVVLYAVPAGVAAWAVAAEVRPDYSSVSKGLQTLAWIYLITLPSAFLFHPAYYALLTWTVWADASKSRASLFPSISAVAPQLLWVLIAYLLQSLIVGVAVIFLIVPGIIATLALYATIGVCVVERLGPISSLWRSLDLTRGQRWRLFGLLVIVAIFAWAIMILANLVSMMAGFSLAGATGLGKIAVTTTFSGFGGALGSAVAGSAYVELRAIKDGHRAGDVAAVFA